MMTNTHDQVMMRARTRIQASGELKVEYRLSVNVFWGPLEAAAAAAAASLLRLSMTMVVVDDRTGGQRDAEVRRSGCGCVARGGERPGVPTV